MKPKSKLHPDEVFTKVNHDVNGNPRYVCHFLTLINASDEAEAEQACKNNPFRKLDWLYTRALNKSRELGGRKFHNKQYGGGIVFQSYDTHDLLESVERIRNTQQK